MNLAPLVESTLLRADATREDIRSLCREARVLGVGFVVVQPVWVAEARDALEGGGTGVVTVAGFPLGGQEPAVKVREAELAVLGGAVEIDFVLSLGWLRGGEFARVEDEVKALSSAVGDRARLKAIVECGLLTPEELAEACGIIADQGLHFAKTSSGFGPRGATVEDVRALRALLPPGVGVKAAGGIRGAAEARALVEAGAARLGTSSAARVLQGEGA